MFTRLRSSRRRSRPLTLAALSTLAAILVVLAFSWGYNNGVGGGSPLLCALHTADCSTAFATWVLCMVTVGTIATGVLLFALETKNSLATFACAHGLEVLPKFPAAESGGSATHARYRRARSRALAEGIRQRNIYVVRRYERVFKGDRNVYQEHRVPRIRFTPTERTKYVEYYVDVENLGRSPLINLYVDLKFQRTFGDGVSTVMVELPLGALGDKKELHVVIHIEATLNPKSLTLTGHANDDGLRFTFRPIHQPERRRTGAL